MEFEYDKIKSQSNKNKHGIDFNFAQKLWEDDNRIVIPAKTKDEQRFAVIGRILEKTWTAFYTLRNEKIRLISIRRARKEEEEIYEG